MEKLVHKIPPLLTDKALQQALAVYPAYDPAICRASTAERLIALNDLYDVVYPFHMTSEIYSKLFLALTRSLKRKTGRLAVMQRNQNSRISHGQSYSGIIGGCDSFTIIGRSGIGKSTAISRAISLIGGNRIIELEHPFTKVIPILVVQTPWDCSIKNLLLTILYSIDDALGTHYYQDASKYRATTDTLIGLVSNACLNHCGVVIADEAQNCATSKNGANLIGSLTQLINNSGVSICLVSTPEGAEIFEKDYKLARRSLGLNYSEMPLNQDFVDFVTTLYRYKYVSGSMELSDGIIQWLYDHSGGIIANVVTLLHDAQEIAILDGSESVTLDLLTRVYRERLGLLHSHIALDQMRVSSAPKPKKQSVPNPSAPVAADKFFLTKLAADAKAKNTDIITLLKMHIPVIEVTL
jgi:hypothetical protein